MMHKSIVMIYKYICVVVTSKYDDVAAPAYKS